MNTDRLRAQLILHEGLRLKAYMDTTGHLTIGVGRNLDGKGITKAEAFYLLDNDIRECVADLETFEWFDELNEVRQRVVLDMRFNMGPAVFRTFTATIATITRGRYQAAAEHMLMSKWAKQTKGRATRLAEMMRSGVADDTD